MSAQFLRLWIVVSVVLLPLRAFAGDWMVLSHALERPSVEQTSQSASAEPAHDCNGHVPAAELTGAHDLMVEAATDSLAQASCGGACEDCPICHASAALISPTKPLGTATACAAPSVQPSFALSAEPQTLYKPPIS
jgi:hypothetical protein